MGNVSGPPEPVARWLDAVFGPWRLVADVSWPRPSSRVWRVQLNGVPAFVKVSPSVEAFERETAALVDVLPCAPGARVLRQLDAAPDLLALVTSLVDGEVVRTLQHIADGVRLGLAVKVTNGLGGLRRAGEGLRK